MSESIAGLDTPVALVDVVRLEANLASMAATLHEHGVAHRPHTKTHKTKEIAVRQLAHGAVGITVAKVGEAEVMAAAGMDDIFVAYPVIGEQKYARLVEVAESARVRFALDSVEAVSMADSYFSRRGVPMTVLVEYDGGAGRSGTQSPEAAREVARAVAASRSLELAGVMSYGNAYVARDLDEQERIGVAEGADAVAVAERIRADGIPCPVVSLGSTPTARHAATVDGVTEIRAGVYAFHDLKQCSLGVSTLDQCALTVLATVVSHARPDRYVVDAGLKALAGEDYGWGTYGRILDRPDIVVTGATEEHGIITLPPEVADPGWALGDRVRIIPDHACGCVNMHDALVAVDGDEVVDTWRVIGRGKVR